MNVGIFVFLGACALLLSIKVTAILFVRSRRSGWRRLSRRYPATANAAGRKVDSIVFAINNDWYHKSASIIINGGGFQCVATRVHRLFHPPVFIPWDDVMDYELHDENVLIHIGETSTDTIELTNQAAELIQSYLKKRSLLRRPQSL